MRFQEAYAGWQGKRLTQEDAGQLLGVSGMSAIKMIDVRRAGLDQNN